MCSFLRLLSVFCMLGCSFMSGRAQTEVVVNRQVSFDRSVPAGNYSGIARIHDDIYAVVSDKSSYDGFYMFRISIDSLSGTIYKVTNLGFKCSSTSNRDAEGVAYLPDRNTVVIAGEADNTINEYNLDGHLTGRSLKLPAAAGNYGYESLTFDNRSHTLWTCTESSLSQDSILTRLSGGSVVVRLRTFGEDMCQKKQYFYKIDAPVVRGRMRNYAHGVSEILSLDDGRLLVLEREFAIPKAILGASATCKIYEIKPSEDYAINADKGVDDSCLPKKVDFLPKRLVCEWTTRLGLFNHSVANYEGTCLGPKLKNGVQVVILVADSQNRAGGILKDWFKTILLPQNSK